MRPIHFLSIFMALCLIKHRYKFTFTALNYDYYRRVDKVLKEGGWVMLQDTSQNSSGDRTRLENAAKVVGKPADISQVPLQAAL
jgi:hypothetical protein